MKNLSGPNLILLFAAGLLASAFCGLFFGSEILWFSDAFPEEGGVSPIFSLRLLRVGTAFAVGSALALAGAVYQAVLRNALAEPFILGVSAGASLGAALAFACGWGAFLFALPIASGGGGLLALGVVLALSRFGRRGPGSLLLSGVAVGTIASSVLMSIVSLSGRDELCSISYWMLGDLQSPDLNLLLFFAVANAGLSAYLFSRATAANALSFGAEYAWSVGVNPQRGVLTLALAASLLASFSVALCGIIGFAGLVVPHIMRRLFGADNRRLFPVSYFAGGIFLILCDLFSRVVHPARELPIGVVTSIVGGALFLWILNFGSVRGGD